MMCLLFIIIFFTEYLFSKERILHILDINIMLKMDFKKYYLVLSFLKMGFF